VSAASWHPFPCLVTLFFRGTPVRDRPSENVMFLLFFGKKGV